MDKSCLVRVGAVNTTTDKTREFCLVSTQFPICKVSVILNIFETERLQVGNWVETRQNCLVLSAVVLTAVRTLPLSPERVAQKRFFRVFKNKSQVQSNKVCYKVSMCQRQSCSMTIPVSKNQTIQKNFYNTLFTPLPIMLYNCCYN